MEDSVQTGVVEELFREGLIRTWYRDQKEGWILRSGKWSPFYVQLRPLVSRPVLLNKIGSALANLVRRECPQVNKLVGVAMAGIPIAVATSINSGIPAAYTRKLESGCESSQRAYGEHALIEGELHEGDVAALIDDVVTRFDSKLEALKQLNDAASNLGIKVSCHDVCVVVDRLQGGLDVIQRQNIRLHSLIQLTPDRLESLKPFLDGPEFEVIADYLNDPEAFQNTKVRDKLSALSRARR